MSSRYTAHIQRIHSGYRRLSAPFPGRIIRLLMWEVMADGGSGGACHRVLSTSTCVAVSKQLDILCTSTTSENTVSSCWTLISPGCHNPGMQELEWNVGTLGHNQQLLRTLFVINTLYLDQAPVDLHRVRSGKIQYQL